MIAFVSWNERTTVCRTFNCQGAERLFDIVWDDPPPPLRMCATNARPQAAQVEHPVVSAGMFIGFPVVIGAGSHPFPFRTRKLSLLPPMVLRG